MRKRKPITLASDYKRTQRSSLVYSAISHSMEREIAQELPTLTKKQIAQREYYEKRKEDKPHYDGWKGGTRKSNAGHKKGVGAKKPNGLVAKSIAIGKSANYFSDMKKNWPSRYETVLGLGDGDVEKGYYMMQKIYKDTAKELNKASRILVKNNIPLKKFSTYIGKGETSVYKLINAINITHEKTYQNGIEMLKQFEEFIIKHKGEKK